MLLQVALGDEARVDRADHDEQRHDAEQQHHLLAAERCGAGPPRSALCAPAGRAATAMLSLPRHAVGVGRCAHHRRGDRLLASPRRARTSATSRPLAHHQDAVAHAQDLRQLARDHQDRQALLRELAHQAVDLGLGADVDAAGRLVQDQDARLGREPFAEHHLLLVAAGELADDLLDAAARGSGTARRCRAASAVSARGR